LRQDIGYYRGMRKDVTLIEYRLPRWLLVTYGCFTLGIVPWIVFLLYSLPSRHVSRHWDVMWVGFDMALLAVLTATLYLGHKRSGWIVMPAVALATLLVADAWFDILTAHPGPQLAISLATGLVLELPVAVASAWLAARTMRRLLNGWRQS